MMKITNYLNLPQPIVDAVKADTYSRGKSDISVTQLIDPPQKVWLEEQHKDEITQDVSDMIWALLGKTVHEILEKSDSLMPTEKRLFAKCGGWTISGGMDRIALMALDDELDTIGFGADVQDYKFTSAWSIALEKGVKQDWINQLNCYAWLLRENGYDPQKLTVVAFLRDWSKLEAKRKPDYPQSQVMVIDVPMWSISNAQAYIQQRIGLHQQHRGYFSKEPANAHIPCTPEERWGRPTKFAVMKEGRKSALRVMDTQKLAWEWAFANGHGKPEGLKSNITIVERPGEAVRCENYCNAAPFCPQFQGERE